MSEPSLKEQIAKRIAEGRKASGLSQGQLAKIMKMHRPTISEIEAGRRNVSAEELTRLADIFGVKLTWLTCSDEDQSDKPEQLLIAARELGNLKSEDLDKVIALLKALKK